MSLSSPLVPISRSSNELLRLSSEILRLMPGISTPCFTKSIVVTPFGSSSSIGLESFVRPIVTSMVVRIVGRSTLLPIQPLVTVTSPLTVETLKIGRKTSDNMVKTRSSRLLFRILILTPRHTSSVPTTSKSTRSTSTLVLMTLMWRPTFSTSPTELTVRRD